MIFHQGDDSTLLHGDALQEARTLADGSADCIVTSPPYYGLRDYGTEGQYGLEESPEAYVETMRALFSELRRVLADDGTLWLNIGDSYSSGKGGTQGESGQRADRRFTASGLGAHSALPPKNLLGIPWRVAFALQADGWILRNSIIWHKPNAMPESVLDRLNCRHENLFLFTKSQKYWFDLDPIREELIYPDAADGTRVFGGANKGNQGGIGATERRRGGKPWARPAGKYTDADKARAADGARHTGGRPKGKNPGDVWSINTQPFPGSHFAVFPQELARRCILSGCKPGGTVLDPFNGSGTTGRVALTHGRQYVGIDISADYLQLTLNTRLNNIQPVIELGA